MALAVTSSTLSGAVSSRNILHSAGRKVRGGQLKTKIHQQAIRLIQFSLQFYTFNTDIMIDIHIQMLREETKSENYRERYSTKQTACKSRNHPPPAGTEWCCLLLLHVVCSEHMPFIRCWGLTGVLSTFLSL